MEQDKTDIVLSDWSKERPELSTEALAIALRVQALSKILAEKLTVLFQAQNLEWWEYDVLSALRRQGNPYRMSASQIADATRLSLGAMTNRIDGLTQRNFVERIIDANDRRRVFIQLTSQGVDLIDRVTSARFESAKDSLESLSTAEKEVLNALLRRIVVANEKEKLKKGSL